MKFFLVPIMLLLIQLSACGSVEVAAWQKGNLAKPVMQRESSASHSAVILHTSTSKEGTQGGFGIGAGGCGCN